ncbi:VIN3-like protein 1 [Iris pallida]|uniref:VIN3-like protein 1 n=1 Tax=Iris pallida TaxID=29817 RepID=A0AAX6F5I0_IRIPA|nr:VIN3-like protein 1 [Iris pallida]KAJ6842352.1 VIN3-like protein 1 [Iris pallida]
MGSVERRLKYNPVVGVVQRNQRLLIKRIKQRQWRGLGSIIATMRLWTPQGAIGMAVSVLIGTGSSTAL